MRRLTALLSVLAVPLLVAPAVAIPRPASIPLPVDFQPEGIDVGRGNTFYVGSMRDGDIYKGDLRSGKGRLLVDVTGRAALGMRVDRPRHRLVVAGGATGHSWVYNTRTGATVADIPMPAAFCNDVTITRHALYFTDSFAPTIYRVPIDRHGHYGTAQAITVTGPAGTVVPGGFGLNGIDATNRRWLMVDHTALGILALVDRRTGVSRQITLSGPPLEPGTLDGLRLKGRSAWVVENTANTLVRVHFSANLTKGAVVDQVTSSRFHVPTGVARHGRWLEVVNARFDLGLPPPFGPGAPPGTTFDVVQLRP